jgi:hypothetical protein
MEASHGNGNEAMALSAAEEAWLRRFVRRHALSGLPGRAVVVAVLLALGLALRPVAAPERAATELAPAAAVAALDAESEALHRELAARSAAAAPDAASCARARPRRAAHASRRSCSPEWHGEAEALRLEVQRAVLGRLDALESRTDTVPAAPQP